MKLGRIDNVSLTKALWFASKGDRMKILYFIGPCEPATLEVTLQIIQKEARKYFFHREQECESIISNIELLFAASLFRETQRIGISAWGLASVIRDLSSNHLLKHLKMRRVRDLLNYIGMTEAQLAECNRLEREFMRATHDDPPVAVLDVSNDIVSMIVDKVTPKFTLDVNSNKLMYDIVIRDSKKELDELRNPPAEYIAEDEWYAEDDANAPNGAFSSSEEFAYIGVENDNACMTWVQRNTKEEKKHEDMKQKKDGEVVEEKKLDDRQKLIGIKVGSRIKYLVVASDFDVARAPQIYNMLVRDELKLGANYTTDRISRMIEINELIEAGFTAREIADYFNVSVAMIHTDRREWKRNIQMVLDGGDETDNTQNKEK